MADREAFDDLVDESWREFRAALADHLATMADDDDLILAAASADLTALPVTLSYWRADGHVVCFARVDGLEADPDLLGTAETDGWRPVGAEEPDTVRLALPGSRVDQLAAVSVTMLRETGSVAHPSFVHAQTSAGPLQLTAAMAGPPVEPAPHELPTHEHPSNPTELHDAVARTLAWKYGTTPVTDEDDDFLLTLDGFAAYVLPHPKQPQVRILVPLLLDVTGRTRAAEVLTELTRKGRSSS